MSAAPIQFTLRITNTTERPQTVMLEPWTGEYRLPPGVPLDLRVQGTPCTPLHIEIEDDRVVVTSFDTMDGLITGVPRWTGIAVRARRG